MTSWPSYPPVLFCNGLMKIQLRVYNSEASQQWWVAPPTIPSPNKLELVGCSMNADGIRLCCPQLWVALEENETGRKRDRQTSQYTIDLLHKPVYIWSVSVFFLSAIHNNNMICGCIFSRVWWVYTFLHGSSCWFPCDGTCKFVPHFRLKKIVVYVRNKCSD